MLFKSKYNLLLIVVLGASLPIVAGDKDKKKDSGDNKAQKLQKEFVVAISKGHGLSDDEAKAINKKGMPKLESLIKKAQKDLLNNKTKANFAKVNNLEELKKNIEKPGFKFALDKAEAKYNNHKLDQILSDAAYSNRDMANVYKNGLQDADVERISKALKKSVDSSGSRTHDDKTIKAIKKWMNKIIKKQNEIGAFSIGGARKSSKAKGAGMLASFNKMPMWKKSAVIGSGVGVVVVAYKVYNDYQAEKKKQKKQEKLAARAA